MEFSVRHWCRISLFNLLVLSLIGVTLRYKIAYYFSVYRSETFTHGHSHFAFAGWVSMALMVLMVHYLEKKARLAVLKIQEPPLGQPADCRWHADRLSNRRVWNIPDHLFQRLLSLFPMFCHCLLARPEQVTSTICQPPVV